MDCVRARVFPVLTSPSVAAPIAEAHRVTFRLADPNGRLRAVRLMQDLGLAHPLDFTRRSGLWTLRLPRPPVDRMEYLFEVVEHNEKHATITDPGNPLRTGGAFGDKSVVQFPGYREPAWLALPGSADFTQPFSVKTRSRRTISGVLWSPDGLDPGACAPLLIVHDGPEYATLGSFTHYLGAMIAAGTLPAMRAALLAPGDRNTVYAANRAYARSLCLDVVPALDRLAPTSVRVGVGVSLGALAILHAHRSHPSVFGGLILQSGSFFTLDLDPQERDFSGFDAVTGFVTELENAPADGQPVPTAMTCGVPEENLANNVQMAATLSRLGYPTEFREVRDAHNYVAWRDALDPVSTDLLKTVVATHAA